MRGTIHLALGLLLLALGACADAATPAGPMPTAAVTPTVAAPTVFSSPLTHASPLVQPMPLPGRALPFNSVARRLQLPLGDLVYQSSAFGNDHLAVITSAGGDAKLHTSLGIVEPPFDSGTVEKLRAVDYQKNFAVVVFRVGAAYPELRLLITGVVWQDQGVVVFATFDSTVPRGGVPAISALHYHIVAVEKAPDVEWGREILVRLNVNGKEVQQQRYFIP